MNKLHKPKDTPAKLNRKYAIILYAVCLVMFICAMAECVYIEAWFHVPLFVCFIVSFAVQIYSVVAYKFTLELRVLYVNMLVILFCIVANMLFTIRLVSIATLIRSIFLLVLMLIGLWYRREYILHLWQEARALMAKDGGAK